MKNLRKIKLALSVGLINKPNNDNNMLAAIREMMTHFSNEVGNFIEMHITKQVPLTAALENQSYAMRFENAVLNVDVVTNRSTDTQYIQGFNLR